MASQTQRPLTRRQREFLSRFLDLYKEAQEPIHYTEVARRLGIGKVTAYEMLRLLEERGLARSEFRLPEGKRGPGRASVVFAPTPQADQALAKLAGPAAETEDWEAIKAQILTRLRASESSDYENLLADLLARLPERRRPLLYMAELTTAILLALRTWLEGIRGKRLRRRLLRIGLPGEPGLGALTGLSLALEVAERVNRRLASAILRESDRYQRTLQMLSEENQRSLAAFAREVVRQICSESEETPDQAAAMPHQSNPTAQ